MADFVHIESPTKDEFPTEPQLPTQKEQQNDLVNMQPPRIEEDPEDTEKPSLKFLDTHPFVRSTVVDKIYGCIIGSALGDTIGLYTEFLPKSACETVYKAKKFSLVEPVTDYYPDSHRGTYSVPGVSFPLNYIHNIRQHHISYTHPPPCNS